MRIDLSGRIAIVTGASRLVGIGAATALPALAALGASNYEGRERALMYGVLGGVAGAGIALGPIVGGAATEFLSWRVVFAGEVVLAIAIQNIPEGTSVAIPMSI